MIHIKKFSDKVNEEFFGGNLKDQMIPRVDQLIEFLQDYKEKLSNEDYNVLYDERTDVVDKIWQDVFHPVPNNINSKNSSFNK